MDATTFRKNRGTSSRTSKESQSSFVKKYFLLILLTFGLMSFMLSTQFIVNMGDQSFVESHLQQTFSAPLKKKFKKKKRIQAKTPDADLKRPIDDEKNAQAKHIQKEKTVTTKAKKAEHNEQMHRLAGLNCDKFGGPSEEVAEEMVYWEDIPSDANFVSPFHKHDGPTQYMTFEPDQGGWNNIRMSMETLFATAFAMGRTLVLPPQYTMYLLGKGDNNQRKHFSFEHFFHTERISQEHVGYNIISMEEYLTLFMDGRFKDAHGKPIFPPGNRTNWNAATHGERNLLRDWMRKSANTLSDWDPEECVAAFPRSSKDEDMEELNDLYDTMKREGFPKFQPFVGKPTPVDASPKERLKENWASRKRLCLYDKNLQQAPWVHMGSTRMLIHFYAFLFFADWKMDLWTKRFIRDHVRYTDEIQCAAARVVAAIRKRSKSRGGGGGGGGEFDTMHVRRGDFQYTVTRSEAKDIYEMASKQIPDNTTVYIATDERKKDFFDPLRKHYDAVFLDDFKEELKGVNTNYYGMIDQLVASRGRIFYGCWFSTFTGYINRLRGYHADDHETEGYKEGIIPSYYYALKDRYLHMQTFYPVKKSFYAREFPTSWRLIDTGVTDNEQNDK